MHLEIGAIDLLGAFEFLRLEQRGAQPVMCGERQRLGLVVLESLLKLRRLFESLDRCRQITARPQHLAFQNAANDSEKVLRRMRAEGGLRRVGEFADVLEKWTRGVGL